MSTATTQAHVAPDRERFVNVLQGILEEPGPGMVAVVIVQVRRLREINAELGYAVGDELLSETAARIESCLRGCDRMVRLSSTEFGLVLPRLRTTGQPQLAAGKVLRTCAEPLASVEAPVTPRLSFGISLFPGHGTTAYALLARADQALSRARECEHDVVFYQEGGHEQAAGLGMERELGQAIENQGLDVVFQPKIALASGALSGVEMLARWESPRFGVVDPERFIAIAERSGLIVPLTEWALRAALRECRSWTGTLAGAGMAVNLSARLLSETQLPAMVEHALGIWGVNPGSLTLEVTESALMTDPDLALRTLEALHALGLKLSIDDFGTGYSSLAYLKKLPVDELKVDKSFVMNMARDRDDHRIVQSVVDLASNFELSVVAEGVEDEPTLARLADMGCGYAQGYYIARPLPAAKLEPWVAASPWGAPSA